MVETIVKNSHYNKHPSGIECKDIVYHLNGNMFNAIKYMWRYKDKGTPIFDLQKACEYINWELEILLKFPKEEFSCAEGICYVLNNYPVINFSGYFSININMGFCQIWEYFKQKIDGETALSVNALKNAQEYIEEEIKKLEKEVMGER